MLDSLTEADSYQIMKRTDLGAQFKSNKELNLNHASLSINSIDFKVTNR
jgi:hypothetical protein